MATRGFNFNLNFTANTAGVEAKITTLKKNLYALSNQTEIKFNGQTLTADLTQASQAATQLKHSLEAATNVNTGNLNLVAFNKQLKQSGMSVEQYRIQLSKLGPEGQTAFAQLTSSIQTADKSLTLGSKLVHNFAKSLKNVITWNISSTIFNTITSQLRQAVGYASSLNKSLNDIRIVTGKSKATMDGFAKSAQQAARALSVSTKDYVEASLIFFQQGLTDEQVEERTKAVLNLAKVTGEAAEDVSSYMTAIWNNFAKGEEALESYADKLTALGAATAASTDEIAAGMEKFAAVADTVELSYTYAAAAVATVIDKTRQSADTVGTSFKTIFARLESLSLGETLEDGVDMTKYSTALKAVGVHIMDANGNLKSMDTILDELGAKWEALDKNRQVALAQDVGGMKQYNNFLALLDNYDSFKANVKVAEESEGTLERQGRIYASSWEAATTKVKTELEGLYDDLISDDFMIEVLDFFKDFVGVLRNVIAGMGGVQGLLFSISSLLIKIKRDSLSTMFNKLGSALNTLRPSVRKREVEEAASLQSKAKVSEYRNLGLNETQVSTTGGKELTKGKRGQVIDSQELQSTSSSSLERMVAQENALFAVSDRISEADKERARTMLEIHKAGEMVLSQTMQEQEEREAALKSEKDQLLIEQRRTELKEKINSAKEKADEAATTTATAQQKFDDAEANIKSLELQEATKKQDIQQIDQDLASEDLSAEDRETLNELRRTLETELAAIGESLTESRASLQQAEQDLQAAKTNESQATTNLQEAEQKYKNFNTIGGKERFLQDEAYASVEEAVHKDIQQQTAQVEVDKYTQQETEKKAEIQEINQKLESNDLSMEEEERLKDARRELVSELAEIGQNLAKANEDLKTAKEGFKASDYYSDTGDLSVSSADAKGTMAAASMAIEEKTASKTAMDAMAGGLNMDNLAVEFDDTEKSIKDLRDVLKELIEAEKSKEGGGDKDKIAEMEAIDKSMEEGNAPTASQLATMNTMGTTEQQGKINSAASVSFKGSEKEVKQLTAQLTNLTKQADLGDKELKEIEQTVKDLKDGKASVGQVQTALKTLQTQSRKTEGEIDGIEALLLDIGEQEGLQDQAAQMAQLARESGEAQVEIENVSTALQVQGEENVKTLGSMTKATFGDVLTSTLDVATSAAAAISGLKQIGSIWADDDLSTTEKLLQTFMSLSTVIPIVQTVTGLLTKSIKAKTAAENADTKATLLGTGADLSTPVGAKAQQAAENTKSKALGKSTAAQWANNLAIMSNPWMIGIALAAMAIAVIAIGAVAGANAVATKEQERNNAEAAKGAEQGKESIKLLQEQTEKIHDLTDAYHQNVEAMDASVESQAKVAASIRDLAAAYEELGVTVPESLKGVTAEQVANAETFKSIQQQVRETEKAAAQKSVTDAKSSMESVTDEAVTRFNADSGLITDEGSVGQAANGVFFKAVQTRKYSHITTDGERIRITGIDKTKPETIINAFEQVEALVKEGKGKLSSKQAADSSTLEGLEKWLEDNQEYYDAVVENNDTVAGINKQAAYTLAETSDGRNMSNVDNVSDYIAVRNEMAKDVGTAFEDEDDLSSYLSTEQGEFEAKYQHIAKIAKSSSLDIDTVADKYDKFSEQEKRLFMSLDPSQHLASWEDVKKAMAEAKEYMLDADIDNLVAANEMDDTDKETYLYFLTESNHLLKDNSLLAKQVAKDNLQVAAGLKKLKDSWKSNFEILNEGTVGTVEYSKAVGAVQKSLEETFGIKVSASWLANDKNRALVDKVMSGQLDQLPALQAAMAADAAAATGQNIDLTDFSAALQDSTLDVGDQLDKEAYAELQKALDNGASEEDILKIFDAAGLEADIEADKDGKLKITKVVRTVDATTIDTSFLEGTKKEVDILSVYNKQVEKATKNTAKFANAKKKAVGSDLVRAISDEINALEEERDALDALVSYTEDEKQKAQAGMEGILATHLGWTEDKIKNWDGTLSFEDLLKLENANLDTNEQKALDDYNKKTKDWENAVEQREKNIDTILERKWERHEAKIELQVELDDMEMKKLDRLLNKYEGKIYYGQAYRDTLETEMYKIVGSATVATNQAKDALNALDTAGVSLEQFFAYDKDKQLEILSQDQIDALKNLPDTLIGYEEKLAEIREKYEAQLQESFEFWNNELTKKIDVFAVTKDILSAYRSLVENIGKEALGVGETTVKNLAKTQLQTTQKSLQSMLIQQQTYTDMLAQAQSRKQNAQDAAEGEAAQAEIDNLTELLQDVHNNILATWEESLTLAQEMYQASIEEAFQQAEETLANGYKTLEDMQESYNQSKTLDQQHLEEYAKIYELSKLTRQINQSMNNMSSIKGKQQLADVLERINEYKKEDVKMSAQELKILQQEYDLRLAEIALEDSLNSKTQVKLAKNADGNLSYIYTANQDAIDQAQQTYEDKMYAYQKSNAEYIDSISSSWLAAETELVSKMTEIWAIADPEERAKKFEEVQAFYSDQFQFFSDEMAMTIQSNESLFNNHWLQYSQYANNQLDSWITTWQETDLQKILGTSSLTDRMNEVLNTIGYINKDTGEATGVWGTVLGLEKSYKEQVATISSLVTQTAGSVEQYLQNSMTTMNNNAATQLDAVSKAADNLKTQYQNLSLEIDAFITKVISGFQALENQTDTSLEWLISLLNKMGVGFTIDTEALGKQKVEDSMSTDSSDTSSTPLPPGAATGGYLDAWGPEGKLLVVHEKELILNKFQTEDLFVLANMAQAYIQALSSMDNLIPNLNTDLTQLTTQYHTTQETITQDIVINADFPGVTSALEIEDAFNNIVNMATQYTHQPK